MSIKARGPWILATLQLVIATLLLYWDHTLSDHSMWDAWSLPAGLLLILDSPALVLTLPFGFLLQSHDLLSDVIFLCMVFLLWTYVGFLLRSPSNPTTSSKPWWVIRLATGALAIAASLLLLAGLFVSSVIKVLALAFWAVIVGLIAYRRVWCAHATTTG